MVNAPAAGDRETFKCSTWIAWPPWLWLPVAIYGRNCHSRQHCSNNHSREARYFASFVLQAAALCLLLLLPQCREYLPTHLTPRDVLGLPALATTGPRRDLYRSIDLQLVRLLPMAALLLRVLLVVPLGRHVPGRGAGKSPSTPCLTAFRWIPG